MPQSGGVGDTIISQAFLTQWCYSVYTRIMSTATKYKPTANPALAAAFRELRRGSRTSPHETRNKRMRTKERVISRELRTY